MRHVKTFFDGSCEPVNPGGKAGWGFAVLVDDLFVYGIGGIVWEGAGMTNNIAEYHALIECLDYLSRDHSDDYIEVFGDSNLVVNMVNGTWGRKNPHKKAPHLLPLCLKARKLLASFDNIILQWIPREENQLADWYSKQRSNKSPLRTDSD